MSTWQIEWRGRTWTDDDLTGQHLATLALISGDDRFESLQLTPDEVVAYPTEGYMRLMFMVSALAAVDACNSLDDDDEAQAATVRTLAAVQAATADEIIGCIKFHAVV